MNDFNLFNFLNCLIESLVLLILWMLLVDRSFRKYKYAIAYLLLSVSSFIITLMNSFAIVALPINLVLLFFSMYGAFHHLGAKNIALHAVFAFLVLLYIQAILLCILPRTLLGSDFGNLIVNTITLCIAIVLTVFSHKYQWAVIYRKNRKMMWLYILASCIPEIIIMQLFSSAMTPSESPIMVSLILLQILYSVLLLFALFIHNRKAEKRQLEVTQKSIKTLNEYLDDSRKLAHDFNKHIHYIRSVINTQSDQPELIETINLYCADILAFSEEEEVLLQLDDPMFRALLSSRQMQAKTSDISFEVDASSVLPEFPVANFQLVDIIGNLMDNAFECVSEMETNRWIRVKLQVTPIENGCFEHVLCIQNPYETLDYQALLTQKGYTSKGENHSGIGLQNVRKIVSDTDGQLVLNNDNNIFTVKVIYHTKGV